MRKISFYVFIEETRKMKLLRQVGQPDIEKFDDFVYKKRFIGLVS
jgi:hypothetical protein